MAMIAPPSQSVIPFLMASRLIRKQPAVAKAYVIGGSTLDVELEPLGYTKGLWVRVSGTVTAATAALVFNGSGACAASPYDVVQRFYLDTPGPSSPIDISGDQAHLQALLGRPQVVGRQMGAYDRIQPLDNNAYGSANQEDVAPTAIGANTWVLWYYIPFTRNARDTVRGLMGLGHQGTRTRLRITPPSIADFVTTPANLTGQNLVVDVWQDIFTAPPAGAEQPPDRFVVTMRQQVDGNPLKLGDNAIDIDPTGLVLNVVHRVIVNNAADTADIATVRLETNYDRIIDDEALDMFLKGQLENRGAHMPLGVIAYDRDRYAADIPFVDQFGERPREAIHAGELNRLRSTVTLKAATALGTVSKIVTSVRRLEVLGG